MLFTLQQPRVRVTILPSGKRDVLVLANEEVVIERSEDSGKEVQQYQYDGNQFRTVHELNESDIAAEMEKYLTYSTRDEPTQEQIAHDNALIDAYTLELMEGGVL